MLYIVWVTDRVMALVSMVKAMWADCENDLMRLADERDRLYSRIRSPKANARKSDARKRPFPRVDQWCRWKRISALRKARSHDRKRQKAMGMPDPRATSNHDSIVPMIMVDDALIMGDREWDQFREHIKSGKPLPVAVEELMDMDRRGPAEREEQ